MNKIIHPLFFRLNLLICVLVTSAIYAINPPKITATSNPNPYCPGTLTNIVETVHITYDPLDPNTNAVYVQIASGYVYGQDVLTLTGNHPTIASSWSVSEGKLTLTSITGSAIPFTDFQAAIAAVKYSNSTTSPTGERSFSINLGTGSLSYLPTNKHFYEYVPNLGIPWNNAKAAAETRNYYGLKGYLATLTSAEEAQLAGAQAPGAGWIGGSDAAVEGQWKWVTGPEGFANGGTGTVFWNGTGNGTTPNFALWNTNNGEPNNLGDEDYAHVTAPGVGIPGSWNDLSNTGGSSGDYQPKGYIVEYGGMVAGDVDGIQISASTVLEMSQISITTPAPICGSEKITLQASTSTGTIKWYDSPANGILLQNGDMYTTPPLAATTTFYVDNGCTDRTPITVLVSPLPIANTVTIARHCDDNQDGIYTFNTATLEQTLLNGQTNVTVTYFDQTGNPLKDSNGTLISSPFPASFSTTSQTIKAVVTGNSALHCTSATTISFVVDDLPEAFAVAPTLTTTCDDEPNPLNQDGKFGFNTSSFQATILGTQTGMTVTYFDKNNNPLPSPLPNPFVTGTQSVTVKVENPLNTACFATTTLQFTVNPVPIVNDITIVQCDTDIISDGKTIFNLTVNNEIISTNHATENFTYYTSKQGATTGLSDQISNELIFQNTTPTTMDVWVRVANKTTNCSSVGKITLKVPTTNIPKTYKIPFAPVCDDFLDANGNNNANNNNRDGITTFDFSATKAVILATLPTNQAYTINYYKNQADALAELHVITDIANYRNNGYPNSQDIWIRVDSNVDNACYGLGPYLTLNVEALPMANPVTITRQCDDNNDGIFSFNTASLESDLVKGQSNVTVTYFDKNNAPLKDSNGNLITSPFPATFSTTSQTIKAVITNTTPQKCFDQTTIAFIVDAAPVAFAVDPSLTLSCDDEANPINQDGKIGFDTTTFQTTILGGQTNMIVKYFDKNGTALPSPLPNPFVTGTQTVTAKVENPLNTICSASTTLNFIVNPIPNIDLNTDGSANELVCSNIATFFVTLDAGILDNTPTNNYDYLWTKDGATTGTNSPTLEVNTEGLYTVTVTSHSGCSRTRTIKVTASNKATNVTVDVVDLTDVNTITVTATGIGKYEYSLDEPSGYYQDSNFFSNVPSGVHVIYVNDKNGCGYLTQEVVLVGVPKYFTPNNDSFNDVWEIKGMKKYPNAEITIFDRFGKYITSLNSKNKSWNGTLNGTPLPADDYWFALNLGDGNAVIKGHFTLKR